MFVLKLLLTVVLLYSECYLCYRIVENPFKEPEEYTTVVSNDEISEEVEFDDEVKINFENNSEQQSEFWINNAQETVERHVERIQNKNVAKNVIFFIGDGMSIPTLAAARIYFGQLQNQTGEEMKLSFETFPHIGMSKTYCVDKQVADSACSGTALFTGVKTNYYLIGVNGNVKLNDCIAANNKLNQVSSIFDWAQKAGKATGFVTTDYVTGATPAATYAHSASRKYHCDADVLKLKQNPNKCLDIAQQLIYNSPGKNLNVIYGGGRAKFLPIINGTIGNRLDKKNLIQDWLKMKKGSGMYISNRQGLLSLKLDSVDHVLGLFSGSSLPFHLESDAKRYPTLAEMTVSAINILENIKGTNGYVLMVEGARIDHAHHSNYARLALDETVQLSEAVNQTVNMINSENSLVVVSSDHGHTMSFAGYNQRGGDILGLIKKNHKKKEQSYYTALSYANGPGYSETATYRDIKTALMNHLKFRYPSTVPLSLETHGGDDVGVFALGPWSHLFTGVYEQNVIPHLIAYAACIGDGLTACQTDQQTIQSGD